MKLEQKAVATELDLTKTKGRYCDDDLSNSKIANDLWDKLVPHEGEPDSIHGELILAAQYIYNDVYTNGGYNLSHNIHDDDLERGDAGWQQPEYELGDSCEKHIAALEKWLLAEHQPCVAQVKAFILSEDLDSDIMFDHLVDRVVHSILNTHNIVSAKEA